MATDENPHAYCTWCGTVPNRTHGEVECTSRAQAIGCAWLTGVDRLLAEDPQTESAVKEAWARRQARARAGEA